MLELNTLGDRDEPDALSRGAGRLFHRAQGRAVSTDSLARLERNPLRILDSKDEGDRSSSPTRRRSIRASDAGQPPPSTRRCSDICARFGVPFRENPRIVRGLDYYSHTAFEFVTDRLGAQGTVMAGGRYDGLVAEMGGPPTPAVGWAAGIERLAMLLAGPAARAAAGRGGARWARRPKRRRSRCCRALRHAGIRAEMAYRGNLKRRMERANRSGARAAVIIGEAELARGVAQVKDLATRRRSRRSRWRELAARLR